MQGSTCRLFRQVLFSNVLFTHFHSMSSIPLACYKFAPRLIAITLGMTMGLSVATADDRIEEILDIERDATSADQAAQLEIDGLADETQEAIHEYRVLLQELDRISRYNDSLKRTIADQERERVGLERQINEFGDLERGIVPLLIDMVDDLEQFIELDLPFRLDERRANIERLRDLMERSDVTVAERYRQVMATYQHEVALGRNIESYSGGLNIAGENHTVDFFRVGRVLLAYRTPDREESGYWDVEERRWRALDDRYRRSIDLGLRIAQNLAAPNILELPVAAPQEGE